MLDLSVILPVHNEEAGLEKNIHQITQVLKSIRVTYEIVCVENGSKDRSLEILQKLARPSQHIRVFKSAKGWGNAVRFGISKARGEASCFMVSDGQVEADCISKVYDLYKQNHDEKTVLFKIWRTTRENPTRLANSRIYNIIAGLILGIDSRDINATPKLLNTKILKSIKLTSENVTLDPELLLALKKKGLKWIEIPAVSTRRESGNSTTNWKTVWEMIKWMIVKSRG